jgi:hypothetical protein
MPTGDGEMQQSDSPLIRLRIGWVSCCFLFFGTTAIADDDLEMLRSAHRAAKLAIRTFSAEVSSEALLPSHRVLSRAIYSRSLDVVRVGYLTDSGSVDFLGKDSEIRKVGAFQKKSGELEYSASRYPRSHVLGQCDVWGQMLLEFYTADGGQLDLDEFIKKSKLPPRLKRARLNGLDCLRLTLTIEQNGADTTDVLWLDPTHNYLVRKIEWDFTRTSGHFEAENVEFQEPQPGVFVPVRCIRRTVTGDNQKESATVLRNVRVNEAINDDVFRLPAIPSGTLLFDEIAGTKYPVDSQWRQIGKEQPLVKLRLAGTSSNEGVEYRTSSTREPRPWWRWLIPVSLAVLICTTMLWYWRKRRAAVQFKTSQRFEA